MNMETDVNPELLNRELLKFVKYLESYNLTVWMRSEAGTQIYNWADLVAAYMNVVTGGVR